MTYTFMLGEVERCFTVYHPLNQNGALPVMFAPNCYAKDKLSGIQGLNDKSGGNAAAKRYGFARIGLSTPGIRVHVFKIKLNIMKILIRFLPLFIKRMNGQMKTIDFLYYKVLTSGAVRRN